MRRLIEGQESQRGFVCDTSVTCHVQLLGQNRVIRDVNSRNLQPILVCNVKGVSLLISMHNFKAVYVKLARI